MKKRPQMTHFWTSKTVLKSIPSSFKRSLYWIFEVVELRRRRLTIMTIDVSLKFSSRHLAKERNEKITWNDSNGIRNWRAIELLKSWLGALVQWLWEETHVPKVVGSNPGTVYWMAIFSQHIFVLKLIFFEKTENKRKRGRDCPILKSLGPNPVKKIHLNLCFDGFQQSDWIGKNQNSQSEH